MISTLHLALIIHVSYLIIQCTSFSLPTPQLLNRHPGDGISNSDGNGDDNGDGNGNGGIQNVLQAIRIPTNAPEPIIVTLPNLIPPNQINNLLHNIEFARKLGDLKPTNSYQEDVFSRDLQKDENAFFRSMVQPLVDDNLIPSEYCEDKDTDTDKALEMFVYAVTNYQERLNEEDIIHGANIIQRRQAFERWKSEEGRAIMKLSLDTDMDVVTDTDTDDDADDTLCLGKRFQMPTKVLADLKLLIPQILKGYWEVKDATIVQYALGDTQVPHIDPCDATILICLKNCQEGDGGDVDGGGGGDTCFPMLEIPSSRRLENRAGCGILFFSSEYEEEEAMDIDTDSDTDTDVNSRNRNALSLHHGGKVTSGEKIVVQLMLDWVAPSPGKITSGVIEHAQIVAGSMTNANRGIGTGKGSWIDVLACL